MKDKLEKMELTEELKERLDEDAAKAERKADRKAETEMKRKAVGSSFISILLLPSSFFFPVQRNTVVEDIHVIRIER